jgi:hypothetical protein
MIALERGSLGLARAHSIACASCGDACCGDHAPEAPPPAYRIEPVVSDDGRLRFARQFTCKLLDIKSLLASDDAIEALPGDVYVGSDLPPELQAQGIICVASIAELVQMFNSGNAHALSE